MEKITKQDWINAYQTTLNEYKENTHELDSAKCLKCLLTKQGIYDVPKCEICPEFIFNGSWGCITREVRGYSYNSVYYSKYRRPLILYHQQAVDYLKATKRFNFTNFQKKLVKINNGIAEEYNL